MEKDKKIKGYKGFDKGWTCRGKKYEVGKTYEEDKVDICNKGMHFCEHPLDVFGYYAPAKSIFAEVEGVGEIQKDIGDTKICCSKLTINAEIGIHSLIQAAVKFVFDRAKWTNKKTTTGERGAASVTGWRGAASATGEKGAASATGERGAASATGKRGAASATGWSGAASATGWSGAASATGERGAASATGERGAASATGWSGAASATGENGAASATGEKGAASATGENGAASATGKRGAASATGWSGAASATGKESIACGLGCNCKAKGAKGCWLVLAERDDDWEIKTVKTVKVDGKKIKEDIWYELKNGKFKEVK